MCTQIQTHPAAYLFRQGWWWAWMWWIENIIVSFYSAKVNKNVEKAMRRGEFPQNGLCGGVWHGIPWWEEWICRHGLYPKSFMVYSWPFDVLICRVRLLSHYYYSGFCSFVAVMCLVDYSYLHISTYIYMGRVGNASIHSANVRLIQMRFWSVVLY